MNEKVYYDGRWFWDYTYAGWFYMPEGYYEVGVEHDRTGWLFLNQIQVEKLIKKLDEEGIIKPRLDERLRQEDLKITHRLLDLLDKVRH
jgi:hypothetical protein